MLTIKTGMQPEYAIAKKYASPRTLVLSGVKTVEDLKKSVPSTCSAIISFGLCGGLSMTCPVGAVVVASRLIAPNETYMPDAKLSAHLGAKTNSLVSSWYSSGKYNEANTPEQRAVILNRYHAGVIDDESLSVAQFAAFARIPFAVIRVVSDGWNDDVSITAKLLNADGGINPMEVIKALASDPFTMMKIWRNYKTSMSVLDVVGKALSPTFCWP